MKKLADQVACTRTLPGVDASARVDIETIVERETKRPASATQVGELFGCADERGLNVLLAPREGGGAALTVNDLAPAHQGLTVSALVFALAALAMVGLSVWMGQLGVVIMAVVFAVGAAGFQGGVRLDRWRRRRRVRRLADAIASAISTRVRVEVEGGAAEGEAVEVDGAASVKRARRSG